MNKKNKLSLSNNAAFCEVMTRKDIAKRFLEELLKTELAASSKSKSKRFWEMVPKRPVFV